MSYKNYILPAIMLAIVIGSFIYYSNASEDKIMNEFVKKQECLQYNDLVNTRIKESGRVFENDTYSVKEIFYSPKLNTCLYAWVIYTTFEPTEIYTIDDIFGGSIFTAGLSEKADRLFYKEIKILKK